MKIYIKYIIAIFLVLTSIMEIASASQQWNKTKIKGFDKYWTENENQSRFIIWCHPARKMSGTVIDIIVKGQRAPADSTVKIVVGSTLLKFKADHAGYIQTNCAACGDTFNILLTSLKKDRYLSVLFDDDRKDVFPTKGMNALFADTTCKADKYK